MAVGADSMGAAGTGSFKEEEEPPNMSELDSCSKLFLDAKKGRCDEGLAGLKALTLARARRLNNTAVFIVFILKSDK